MMIETRGLCKSFGEQVVLDDIDLDVEAGRIFALLGPNGVKFDQAALDKASFQGATLKNVSFRSEFIWSNPIKSINFDGAMMDKLTYAALKGLEADVSKVTFLA
jgi:uncharacterized protein YjbI with pentapeptide repeats